MEVCKFPGILCKGFKSGRVSSTSRPSKALCTKYLVSLEEGLEPPEDKRRGCLNCSSTPHLYHRGNFRLDCFSWGTSLFSCPSLSLLSCLWERGTVLIKVLGSFRSCNKLDAPKRCIIDTVLHPPCTELGLYILQFEKCIVMQYLDLI